MRICKIYYPKLFQEKTLVLENSCLLYYQNVRFKTHQNELNELNELRNRCKNG